MVHVMSEITRYDVDGREWELLEFGDGDYVRHADHLIYLREMRMDRDVERLRADTAEAELIIANADKEAYAQNAIDLREQVELWKGRTTNLTHARSVAEQRIADLIELLRGAWKYADHDLNVVTVNRELAARIEAALNKKSEGESHE